MSLRRIRLRPGLAAGLGVCSLILATLARRARARPISTGGIILAPPTCRRELLSPSLPGGITLNLSAGNYMTPVRDQAQVGSCWAFAAIEALLRRRVNIVTGTVNSTLDLSEQNLICAGHPEPYDYTQWESYPIWQVLSPGMVRRCRKRRLPRLGPRLHRLLRRCDRGEVALSSTLSAQISSTAQTRRPAGRSNRHTRSTRPPTFSIVPAVGIRPTMVRIFWAIRPT